ncbi:hypothetical protein IT084_07790 [Desulfallas sp. Bu1-1]|jgi:hypothetical protein|uniref:hypothetical protein n=1 Tax=Desulfallas sp. Bu1-1 TaxID=2787620 RepID=UPI00189E952E|nr:hypothetical protein [Desulfallas sp. Bu1-1]MBF7082873.1 hypothetical protein [Desulfallas sp. Bu1-1]
MFNVGVKYCGNCNPVINSKKILDALVKGMPGCRFGPPDAGVPALLILSGCETDCATRPGLQVETIVVAGLSVDYVSCKEEDIPEIVTKKLIEIKGRMMA